MTRELVKRMLRTPESVLKSTDASTNYMQSQLGF